MSNKTKTRIFYALMLAAVILFIGFAKLSRWTLEKNHAFTTAVVDDVAIVGRERFVSVKYHYSVNNKQYRDNASFNQTQMVYENFRYLNNKKIPVAYNDSWLGNTSALLLFPQHYYEFNIPFPDSMNWILPLMGK